LLLLYVVALVTVLCAFPSTAWSQTCGSGASVFNYCGTPILVSPAGTGSWVDVDVSAHIPAGATGVILQVKNESSGTPEYGVRKNGSTDTWMQGATNLLKADTQTFYMIGVDSGRIFEVYQSSTQPETYLLGFTMGGVTFFDNAVDKGPASPTTWQTVDISADTGTDTAIGAIFIIDDTDPAKSWDIRKMGSTDSTNKDIRGQMSTMAIIGVDGSEQLEVKVEGTTVNAMLVGYITSGIVLFDNYVDKAITANGTYQDVDITADIGADDATGAIMYINNASDRETIAIRNNGETYNYDRHMSHQMAISEIDAGDIFEMKLASGNAAYLIGYTTATAPEVASCNSTDNVFNYCTAPVDISPTTSGSWFDVDLSSSVPTGATGVIVQWVNASASDRAFGIRKNGSTDTWGASGLTALTGATGFLMAGLDASRIFEIYTSNTAVEAYLIGYTMNGVAFFTNATDKATGTVNSYYDIDISTDTGADTAIGAILTLTTDAGGDNFSVRKKGSTDSRFSELDGEGTTVVLTGVDATEILEFKTSEATMTAYLTGYVTSGAVFFTNALDKSTGTTGSYVDVDITADIGSDNANGAILEFNPTNPTDQSHAVRPNGGTHDHYAFVKHGYGITGIDSGDIFEQKISATNRDLYMVGYTLEGAVLPSCASTSYDFNYCDSPIDVSPTTTASWADVDVSASIPAGATGVILQVLNSTATDRMYGVRKKGSTDTWMSSYDTAKAGTHTWLMVGVDSSGIFEVYQETTDPQTHLIGYTMSGVTFFTNALNKSLGSAGSWLDIDISSDTGVDTAIGAIVTAQNTGNTQSWGIRMNGSTDSRGGTAGTGDTRHNFSSMAMVGVDGGEIFEMRIESTEIDAYLMGYVTSGAVFFQNGIDKSIAAGSTPIDVDITAHIGTDTANGALVEVYPDFNDRFQTMLRPNGATHLFDEDMGHQHALLGIDAGDIFEGTVSDTTQKFWLTGYTVTALGPPSTCASTSYVFNYCDRPIDVSPAGTGAWVDVDVSSYMPAGATGVILHEMNATGSSRVYGVRKNGSTDGWMNQGDSARSDSHGFLMVGLDENGVFELYQETSDIETYLVGYTMSGATFFTNAVDKSIATTGAWTDVDISSDTGAETAIGAIFMVRNTLAGDVLGGVRKNGSTDDFYNEVDNGDAHVALVGLDGSEVAEMKIATTDLDLYLMGYVTSGAVFFTNAVDKSTATTGSYVDVDITGDIGSDDATGALLETFGIDNVNHEFGVRLNGATDDLYHPAEHIWPIVEVDSNDIFEQKIGDVDRDLYLTGYTLAAAAPTGTQILYVAGNTGTILKTTDGGGNWGSQTSGTTENLRTHWFPADDTTGYVVGWGGVIRKTTDSGSNWNSQTSGLATMLLGLHAPTGSIGYAVGELGKILKTGNGGSTWTEQTSGTTEELRAVQFPATATTGYAVGTNGTILKTTDGGSNWTTQTSGTGNNLRSVWFVDANTGYAVGNSGTILKTTDGGSNWNPQTSGTAESLFGVHFPVDATTGYAVGDGPTILKTIDGGTNWSSQTAGTAENLRGVHFPDDATTGYAVGTGGAIVKTTDGGSNWNTQTSGTTQELRGITSASTAVPEGTAANYRSIGTTVGTIYSTGDATVSAGANIVTFAGGASLPANVGQGDKLIIGAETFYILSRDSATQATVQANATAAHTNAAYTISRAYNTFSAWETAQQGNLVGEDRREVGVAYDDGDFTDANQTWPFVISGSTTDATRYMKLTVAEGQRHAGVAGAGVLLTGGGDVIEVQDEYTVVEWIQITGFSGANADGIYTAAGTSANSLIQNVLIYDFASGKTGILVEDVTTIRNTIIYNGGDYGIRCFGGSGTATIENVTVYNGANDGIRVDSGDTATIRNSIAVGHTDADIYIGSGVDYFGYNMYSTWAGINPESYQGNNQTPPAGLEDLFVSIVASSENLHLEGSGHNALNTGLDLSSAFTGDIDDNTRPIGAAWDMGADEAAGPLTISSDANQTFSVGGPTTAILPITVTDDGQTPVITAANDIRIRIPATFNMTWDTSDTTATISGGAVGKVSTTVSYPDSRTLLIDVTSNFAGSDSISVSGLSFTSFSATSSADNLELDIDNNGTADATDDKTIEVVAGLSTSSAANQVFTVGDPDTAISTITVTDNGASATITAANDIRIRIPATFNMTWDTADTTAVIGGGAAAKVSATVSYPDSRTLLVDVTSDFAAADSITISGLSFSSFSAVSSADNLELDTNNDAAADATDDKTVQIVAPLSISSAANQTFTVGDPDTGISTITVTDHGQTPLITAASDIRIRIPATFNMTWDTADTTAVIGGGAAGKVSTTVSYPDSRTLLVAVSSNFAAADSITISGLSFSSFSAVSSADNLELDTNNDAAADATDDKTIQVDAATPVTVNYRSIGTNAATLYSTGTASISSGTSTVTFSGATLPTNIGQGDKLTIGSGSGTITREQTVTGGAGDASTSPVTLPAILGGTSQTYVLSIATRTNRDVTSVTGGGLTWTERVEQCAGRAQQGIRLWTAQGSPGSSFQVTINFTEGKALSAVLSRYSGVDTFEDPVGHNTNGENGICSGGIDDPNAELTLTSTVNGSVHVVAVNHRNNTVSSYSAPYAQAGTESQSSGGEGTNLTTYDRTLDPSAMDTFQATIGADKDWATAGIVLNPTAGSDVFYILSRDSDTQVTVQETAASTLSAQTYTIVRAYNTFSAWEAAREGNLVGENRREVGVAYDDGDFTITAPIGINGSTTDSTRYLKITVAPGQRHAGVAGSGVLLTAGGGLGDDILDVQTQYTQVEWLQITNLNDGLGNPIEVDDAPSGAGSVLQNLLIYDFDSLSGGVRLKADATIRNTILYDGDTGISGASTATVTLHNVSVHGMSADGISASGTVDIRNSISVGSGTSDFDLSGTITYFGYNMYSTTLNFTPASYQGNNQSPPASLEDLFVSIVATSEDLHLETSGHNALNTGLDLSSAFTMDIDEDTRPIGAAWDMGADEAAGLTCASTTYVFNYCNSPIDVTPTTAGSWVDVDVSSRIPAGATGVILQEVNPTATRRDYGVRKNGSTDTWMTPEQASRHESVGFHMTGVDSNRVFEVYTADTTVRTYLLGYTMDGVTFFTNAVDKSLGSTGTWTDIDISADTGADTAIGAIFVVKETERVDHQVALRKKGSTDDRYSGLDKGDAETVLIGVDSNEVAQVKIDSTFVDTYLLGYVTDGAVFFTNAVDKQTGTTGTYVDVDITGDIGTDNANGAILSLVTPSELYFAVRPKGATHDFYERLTEGVYPVIGIDTNDIFEQKISDISEDLYLTGYTLESAAGPAFAVNYRSIGTNTGTLYSTGTASITSGTSTVTFSGATLPTNIGQGDKLTISATVFHILSRDSATQVTVQETAASTLSGQTYTIVRAYNDFPSWETARDGDLVGENRIEVGVAYNDGEFTPTATFYIGGSTTDATHYMKLTVAEGQRHDGTAGTGVVVNAIGVTGDIFALDDEYTVIEWLELRNFDGGVNTDGIDVGGRTLPGGRDDPEHDHLRWSERDQVL
jgi:photosystem II stability/assembly factor-like uncharacterized protein